MGWCANLSSAGSHCQHNGISTAAEIAGATAVGVCWRPAFDVTAEWFSALCSSSGSETLKLVDDGTVVATLSIGTTSTTIYSASISVAIAADSDVAIEGDTAGCGNTQAFIYGHLDESDPGKSQVSLSWGGDMASNLAHMYTYGCPQGGETHHNDYYQFGSALFGGADNSLIRSVGISTDGDSTTDLRFGQNGVYVVDPALDANGDYNSDSLAVDIDQDEHNHATVLSGTTTGQALTWYAVEPAGDQATGLERGFLRGLHRGIMRGAA